VGAQVWVLAAPEGAPAGRALQSTTSSTASAAAAAALSNNTWLPGELRALNTNGTNDEVAAITGQVGVCARVCVCECVRVCVYVCVCVCVRV